MQSLNQWHWVGVVVTVVFHHIFHKFPLIGSGVAWYTDLFFQMWMSVRLGLTTVIRSAATPTAPSPVPVKMDSDSLSMGTAVLVCADCITSWVLITMLAVSLTDSDECAVNNGGCQQNCINTPSSFMCSCDEGYALASDGMSCNGSYITHGVVFSITVCCVYDTDVDECELGTHNCDQECTNTVGSFTCSCNTGFELDSDGHTCTGRSKPKQRHS